MWSVGRFIRAYEMHNTLPPDEGYVHSVETAGTVDGPGIRFVVFVKGCPLRCLYCQNPDTRFREGGTLMTAKQLAAEIAQYKDFMTRTGGGVTVSGGEPLYQQEFVTAIFNECKKLAIHTALDTSGYLGKKTSDDLLAVTDLVLLDIKSFDPQTYKHLTSWDLQPTLDLAEKLAAMKKPMWIRIVVVPNLTDDLPTLERLADYLVPLGNVERIEILPFHKMGEVKWEALHYPYTLKDTQPPSDELVLQVQNIFKKRGFCVV